MSNQVMISADCVCDIPVKLAERLNVSLMYYYIETEEGRFRDLTEMRAEQILEYMEEGKRAHSCAASTEDYRKYFEGIRKKTQATIIHFCMARNLSRAYDRAMEAAGTFQNIRVVDSRSISAGMGFLVLRAAELTQAGAGPELILQEINKIRRKVQATFVVESTAFAFRTGNLEKSFHSFCERFSLHPFMRVRSGRIILERLYQGNPYQCGKRYLNRLFRNPKHIDNSLIILMTIGCSEEMVEYLERELRRLVDWKKVVVSTSHATISCDCGPGTFGVVYLQNK